MNETAEFEEIGRYKIHGLIGEGAMAQIYKAHDPHINRDLALKILKQERSLDEEYVNRFLREARAAGSLTHPNIVAVYDVGRHQERPYIIIELVDGTPMDQALADGKPLALKRSLSIGIQLAEALDYAHERGIVHRDVKPSNIMLLQDGETIKVADFGIAQIEDADATRHTQAGTVLGTPQYMSPEQVMGQKVDGRSDLFSVGVILYQLFSGRRPFNADTMATLLFQITQEEPPPIAELMPDLPVGLQHVVNKLLAKQPAKRFESGRELARALSRELKVIEEQEQESERHRYVPISVKAASLMAGLIAVTMAVSVFFIQAKQSETLMQFAADSGASLAKFVAGETAVPVLSQDWVAIEIFVEETSRRQTFDYLLIIDHLGVVRGASEPDLVGQKFVETATGGLLSKADGVRTTLVERADGTSVLDFESPILFQEQTVGTIRLGLSRATVQELERTTLLLLIGLAVVTIIAVALAAFVLSKRLARPIRTVRAAMDELSAGNLDVRISLRRDDELGELFNSFNKMAMSLDGLAPRRDTPPSESAAAHSAGETPKSAGDRALAGADESPGLGEETLVAPGDSPASNI